jgi:hypothetical protein
MKHRRYFIEAAILSLLGICVLAPWGCGGAPVAPVPASSALTLQLPNGVIAVPGSRLDETVPAEPGTFDLAPLPYTLDSTTGSTGGKLVEYGLFVEDITSTGGTITLTVDSDTSYFIVPEASLEKTTEISVRISRDLSAVDARITEFDFEPEGTLFDKSAQLAYRTELKDGEKLVLYWWEARNATWLGSAECIVVNGFATFPIDHFSKYRVKERISLGGQRVGK